LYLYKYKLLPCLLEQLDRDINKSASRKRKEIRERKR